MRVLTCGETDEEMCIRDSLYLGSADWMPRNLDRRVELVFPIEEERIRRRVEEVISLLLEDTVNAREQQPDGSYKMVDGRGRPQLNAQWELQSRAQDCLLYTSRCV